MAGKRTPMNIAEARHILQKLASLESLITFDTHEYIWKVLIAPADEQEFAQFVHWFDPHVPFSPYAALERCLEDGLSVYFILKKDGKIIFRGYEEFFSLHREYFPLYPELVVPVACLTRAAMNNSL